MKQIHELVRGFVIINNKERFVVTIGTLKSLFIIFPNVTKEVFMEKVYVHKHQKRAKEREKIVKCIENVPIKEYAYKGEVFIETEDEYELLNYC